jgi:hypothetical protein
MWLKVRRKAAFEEARMKSRKTICSAFVLVIALGFLTPVTRASERDQATQLTFTQSVQIPGNVVLQPGTYWFSVADSPSDRNIVRVFDVNWQPITTTVAASKEIAQPYDNTLVTFAERSANQPVVLLEWFYPGRTTGHEFIYSGREGRALTEETVDIVAVTAEPVALAPAYSNTQY